MRLLLACALLTSAFCTHAQWSSSYADVDQDGCIGVGDVLEVLSLFGDCSATWQCGDTLEYNNYWYETILIGDQCWFAENLRTTIYKNGDLIPAGLTDGEWTSTTSGATAVFGDGSSLCFNFSPDLDACDESQSLEEYGRLYNWYAVGDWRGLCPTGWHVPTDGEWTGMDDFIAAQGYSGNEGIALRSTYGWYEGGNGTDDFGFSLLPGGYSNQYGDFLNAGAQVWLWSSSLANDISAWLRHSTYYSLYFQRSNDLTSKGFSVRCLKDAD